MDEPAGQAHAYETGDARVSDEGVLDRRDQRHMDAPAVEKCAPAAARVVAKPERRGRCDGEFGLAVVLESDQRGPGLVAADEAAGAIDGVDDPAPRGGAVAVEAELLAHDGMRRPLAKDAVTYAAFDRMIDLRHGAQVRFGVDLEVESAKALHGVAVG